MKTFIQQRQQDVIGVLEGFSNYCSVSSQVMDRVFLV